LGDRKASILDVGFHELNALALVVGFLERDTDSSEARGIQHLIMRIWYGEDTGDEEDEEVRGTHIE
jgi:hypothetical protein